MEKIERVGSIIGIIVVCMLVFSVFAQIGLATEDEPGRSPNGLDDAGTVLADPEPGTNSGQINDDVAYDKYGLIYGTVVDQDAANDQSKGLAGAVGALFRLLDYQLGKVGYLIFIQAEFAK